MSANANGSGMPAIFAAITVNSGLTILDRYVLAVSSRQRYRRRVPAYPYRHAFPNPVTLVHGNDALTTFRETQPVVAKLYTEGIRV
jgi:hypothetical protein